MASFKIKDQLCTGCGLCSSISGSIEMKISSNGFIRPVDNNPHNKDIKLINSICPGKKLPHLNKKFNSGKWGFINNLKIVRSTDENILNNASSGGGITSTLNYLINNRIVDEIIQIGPDQKIPYLNTVFIHSSKSKLIENANSRYSPSATLINLKQVLSENNKKFVLVAKPCEIGAFNSFKKIFPELASKVILTISFFCAGIPSLNSTKQLIKSSGIQKKNITSLHYRKNGWPGNFTIVSKFGKIFEKSYKYAWGRVLGKNLQFRCKICPDGIGHYADLVFADAWKSFDPKGYPDFKDAEGQSLMISRSEKGLEISKLLLNENYIEECGQINLNDIDKLQPGQKRRIEELRFRTSLVLFFNRTVSFPKVLFLGYNFLSKEISLRRKFRIYFGSFLRYLKDKS